MIHGASATQSVETIEPSRVGSVGSVGSSGVPGSSGSSGVVAPVVAVLREQAAGAAAVQVRADALGRGAELRSLAQGFLESGEFARRFGGRDDAEVLVVDNASTDGTGAAVRRDFPDVRANTIASFALNDYEWILAFEADELHRIVDLMRALRAAEARRHTREEVPFYTGRRRELAEIVALW